MSLSLSPCLLLQQAKCTLTALSELNPVCSIRMGFFFFCCGLFFLATCEGWQQMQRTIASGFQVRLQVAFSREGQKWWQWSQIKLEAFSLKHCNKSFTGNKASWRKFIIIHQVFSRKVIHLRQGKREKTDIHKMVSSTSLGRGGMLQVSAYAAFRVPSSDCSHGSGPAPLVCHWHGLATSHSGRFTCTHPWSVPASRGLCVLPTSVMACCCWLPQACVAVQGWVYCNGSGPLP